MKLGARLLTVTLALTVGLTLCVGGFVTATFTAREESRARRQIQETIRSGCLERIAFDQRQVFAVVKLLLEDPQCRALLQSLQDESGPARDPAVTQLRDEVLARTVGREVGLLGLRPAFDVLLDPAEPAPILVGTRGDAELEAALRALPPQTWRRGQVVGLGEASGGVSDVLSEAAPVAGTGDASPRDAGQHGGLVRLFIETPRGLFLAVGMPLRVAIAEPPSHAYFIGFRVDDAWMSRLLGGATPGGADAVGMGETAIHAWVRAGQSFVAYGSSGVPLADRSPPPALAALPREALAGRGAAHTTPLALNVHGEEVVGETLSIDGIDIFFVSSLDAALAPLRQAQRVILLVGLAAVALATLLCRWIARTISDPVNRLVEGTQRVAQGHFDEPVELTRRDELGTLAASFNEMTRGLAQRDFIKDTFGKFVDPSVVEGMLANPAMLKPGGEVREQTVLFCDLADFTKISERLSPQDLVRMLNTYLGGAADAVAAERGIVDKYIGDAVVAFWGPPLTSTHADRACRAALRIADHARRLDKLCADLDVRGLRVRVGIATGPVLVGNIGSPSKFNYTVIGDTCNLASRLEGLNKVYGTTVLMPWSTLAAAIGQSAGPEGGQGFGCTRGLLWRVVDRVRVVGRESPITLCEAMAAAPESGLSEAALTVPRGYAAARALYERGEWRAARAAFEALVARGDGPSREMASRCAAFEVAGPPADWDGIWRAQSK